MLERIKKLYLTDNSQVLIGNVSASAFGLVTFMLLARGLSKPDFGAWTLFMSSAGLLDLLRTGLVRQAMVRAVSVEGEGSLNEILSSAGIVNAVISLVLGLIVFLVHQLFDTSGWALEPFFRYYPLLALLTIPSNLDIWKAHAMGSFRRMNAIRLYINILFVIAVASGLNLQFSLTQVVLLYLAANLAVSLYSYTTSIRLIRWKTASKERIRSLLHFGKHSLATMTGVNLLKSADTLIIGATLGTSAVAIYAIPLKALDLVEIPLRGFVMTAFRKLSRFASLNSRDEFNHLFTRNVLFLTLGLLPLVLVCLATPQMITGILGGSDFHESASLLMIFTLVMLLLPLDKFIGVAYDSIGHPKINALKVWLMVVVNIAGDLLVIHFIGTLWAVAGVTILNILMGIVFGLVRHPYLKLKLGKLSEIDWFRNPRSAVR